MNRFFSIFAVLALLCVSACAGTETLSPLASQSELDAESRIQQELILKQAIKENVKVQEIAYKILKANADICPVTDYYLGMQLWSKHPYPKNQWSVLEEKFGMGDGVTVQSLVAGGAAARQGVQVGDSIVAINGTEIPQDKNGLRKISQVFNEVEGDRASFTFSRNGKERNVTLKGDLLCDYRVVYNATDSTVNAYADGKAIYMTRGMYRFVESDTEMALVLAHELAHNTMSHMGKKTQNAIGAGVVGLIVDIFAAANGVNTGGDFSNLGMSLGGLHNSVEFEQEADYVGLYYMARAGYDTSNVANFWRRMVSENHSGALNNRGTHPTSPERFLSIEKTHREILAKKANKQKLIPNLKSE